jgi:hypothetical protein
MTNLVPPSGDDRELGRRFLNLPRELRELVYTHGIVRDTLELTDRDISAPVHHPAINVEWLEAMYAYSTCSVTFSDARELRDNGVQHSLFGNHPEYKRLIRYLVVNVLEAELGEEDLERAEHECVTRKPEARQEWNELLQLPRLESLTINMQKTKSSSFVWANFSPILYEIRERMPKLHVVFNISFDTLLENKWNIDLAQSELLRQWIPRDITNDPYLPMGFVDLTALIAPPTNEDREYMRDNFLGPMDVGSVDIVRGLLDEIPEHRRLLTEHYMVKEPAVLRVVMARHYEIYKRVRKEKEEVEEAT